MIVVMIAALTLVSALALAPAAEAGGPFMLVGAADDVVLKDDAADAASQIERAQQAGLDTLRLTAQWTRGQTALPPRTAGALQTAVVAAKTGGVRIVLSLYPYGSSQTPLSPAARADFTAWAGDAVTLLPSVRDFVVGNEPNLNRFWLPQYGPDGENVAAPAYVALLAETYDAIKAIRPRSTIYGGALSPRGSDRAGTKRDTHSPTRFILDMGAAYRASGRATPIMDALAIHPYADRSNVPPSVVHPDSTSIGIADYPKLVSLLGQAFDGTAQRGSALPILYAEFGVESRIPAGKAPLYTGTEPATVHPVDEATQATFYGQALQLTFCQPTVTGLLLFHYIDERPRPGWQSGLYYVDGTPKTSLARVRAAVDSTRRGVVARCPTLGLTPKLTIATAVEPRLRVTLTSNLDARYTLWLQRIGGKTPRLVLKGTLVGRRSKVVPVRAKLVPGRYRWRATTTAALNPGPARSATSRTFTIR
ncbi:MAG TPA: hypothetical protein VFG75_10035 [Gaiella sp.]|nr:hypothetical protein [Gaiella sp.]